MKVAGRAQFRLERQQAVAAVTRHYRAKILARKALWGNAFAWFGAVVLFSTVVIAVEGVNWLHYWSSSLQKASFLYGAIIISIWLLNYYLYIPSRAKRQLNPDKRLNVEQIWLWDDHNLVIRTPTLKSVYPFRLFYDWREYPDCLILYISKDKFNILPKKALTDDQLADLRIILGREISAH